ncbi:MAG: hypothetical protein ACI9U2_004948 [Bradymonadia bacterium]|jgi:hypothetical protein
MAACETVPTSPLLPTTFWLSGRLALLLALGAVAPAAAREVSHRIDLRALTLIDRSRPGPFGSVLNEDLDDELLGIYAAYGVRVAPHRRIRVRGLLDTNVLQLREGQVFAGPRRIEDEIERTGLIREAWLTLDLPAGLGLGVGKRRARLADGLIFDEYALGAELSVSAGRLQWTMGAWWPGRAIVPDEAPIVGTTLEYQFDLSNLLYLFAFGDAPDAQSGAAFVKDLVSALLPELPTVADCATLRGESLRLWMGGGVNVLVQGHAFRAVGAWQTGHAAILPTSIDAPGCAAIVRSILEALPRVDEPISAFGFDASWRVKLNRVVFAGLFGTWLRGDPEPLGGTWTAFSPPASLLPNTLLFFNGGATSTILDNTLALSGVEGLGVRAFGASLLLVLTDRVEVDLLLAGLWPDAGEGAYGAEYDARLRARLGKQVDLRVEFGALLEGAVYDAPRVWWQANAALNWQWESWSD